MSSHPKFLWLLMLMWTICWSNARQIRINRYSTEGSVEPTHHDVIDDAIEIEAIVREIKLAPYPPAGYRPSMAFLLPNENASDLRDNASETQQSLSTSATVDELDVSTGKTENYPSETKTTTVIDESANAPYPAAGFRPKIPFNLPTENLMTDDDNEVTTEEAATKTPLAPFTTPANVDESETPTPYPSAGYKPSIVFFLPNADLFPEQSVAFKAESQILEDERAEETTRQTTQVTTEEVTTIEPLETTGTPLAEFTTPQAIEVESKTPYAPSGFKPKIIFLLPTENFFREQNQDPITGMPVKMMKAPYPPAGFRPSKLFALPTEELKEEKENPPKDNSDHPPCGSSTNPLAPKPLDSEKTDPDSETIFPNPKTVKVPARLIKKLRIRSRPRTQQ